MATVEARGGGEGRFKGLFSANPGLFGLIQAYFGMTPECAGGQDRQQKRFVQGTEGGYALALVTGGKGDSRARADSRSTARSVRSDHLGGLEASHALTSTLDGQSWNCLGRTRPQGSGFRREAVGVTEAHATSVAFVDSPTNW